MGIPESLGADAVRSVARTLAAPRSPGPELTVLMLTDLPVVAPWCDDDESVMETLYGPLNVPIGLLKTFRLTIVCTGTEPLLAERFQRPVRVDFFDKARLVHLALRWRRHGQIHPDDNAISIDTEDHAVVFSPPLMNPGDALVLNGLVLADGPLDPRLSVRYPNLPAIEELRFAAGDVHVEFDNLDAAARDLRWPWLRKLSPKRWRYRRAAQLRDAINVLLYWDESR